MIKLPSFTAVESVDRSAVLEALRSIGIRDPEYLTSVRIEPDQIVVEAMLMDGKVTASTVQRIAITDAKSGDSHE